MSISLEDLFQEFRPELPGCALEYFNSQALHVAREICTDGSVIDAALTDVDTVAGQSTYALSAADASLEPVSITRLSVNGVLLWDTKYRNDGTWAGEEAPTCTTPPFALNAVASEITLTDDETPDSAVTDGLQAKARLRPTRTATTLPDAFNEFDLRECLRLGLLSRLWLVPAKPWSNAEAGVYYAQRYDAQKRLVVNRLAQQNTRTPFRTRKWG